MAQAVMEKPSSSERPASGNKGYRFDDDKEKKSYSSRLTRQETGRFGVHNPDHGVYWLLGRGDRSTESKGGSGLSTGTTDTVLDQQADQSNQTAIPSSEHAFSETDKSSFNQSPCDYSYDHIASAIPSPEFLSSASKTFIRLCRRLALSASGQIGASVLSALTLWSTLLIAGYRAGWALEMLAALLVVRIAYFHTRGPKPVLLLYQVRKRVNRLLVDETAVGIALTALCFVMSWPVALPAVATFFTSNLILQLCLMSVSRLVIKRLASHNRNGSQTAIATKQAIIIGTGSNARKVADMILDSPELETRLIGFLDYRRKGLWRHHDVPLVGHPDALAGIVANTQVDALFWAVEPLDIPRAWSVLKTAEKMGVAVFVMPSVYEPKLARIRPTYINGMPAMVYRSDPEDQVALLLKNLTDRIGALLGLALASPVMLLTAALVKLTSPGPVLFRQVRSGRNGKQFTLYKFRTMVTDAEARKHALMEHNEMSGPVFKIARDPRITPIGKFLRKFSIDELPQFFNVLRGEMSLVGPRPPLPSEVSRFEPWQHRKLAVKPGLTCLWQVNGRNNIDFEEWMRLDLEYIDNWSLLLDARILLKTVPAVLSGSGS